MRERYLLTQSLLSSWQYSFKAENGYEEFVKALHRERTPPTKAMLDGQRFENIVNTACKGETIYADHEWFKPVVELSALLCRAQQQVKLYRELTVNGVTVLCYGILDYLQGGIIYDTKFSKTYHVGKYLDSPQHPMYFFLTPEAREFQYKICDGDYIYTETYRPEDCEPIEITIKQFLSYLDKHGLVEIYKENWRSKY